MKRDDFTDLVIQAMSPSRGPRRGGNFVSLALSVVSIVALLMVEVAR